MRKKSTALSKLYLDKIYTNAFQRLAIREGWAIAERGFSFKRRTAVVERARENERLLLSVLGPLSGETDRAMICHLGLRLCGKGAPRNI